MTGNTKKTKSIFHKQFFFFVVDIVTTDSMFTAPYSFAK